MTALQGRHSWRLQLNEFPLPALLPRRIDVVRVGSGLGMAALDIMRDHSCRVGFVLCCTVHQQLLVPVESGTADQWGAPHSSCDAGWTLQCLTSEPPSVCQGRFWAYPPEARPGSLTAARDLHHWLSMGRTVLRAPGWLPQEPRAAVACHV
ncbi:hypothetical protein [Streptomyces venezuelae]|uniref:hypothetical protein n=1 Tax=Streptomyces venezuelae TaxID=54571 RepID=UPI00343682FF